MNQSLNDAIEDGKSAADVEKLVVGGADLEEKNHVGEIRFSFVIVFAACFLVWF